MASSRGQQVIHSYVHTYVRAYILMLYSVQEFWRMCDETKAWINEKDIAFSSEDCGKDLASVQLLQRKQQVCTLHT